MTARQDAATDSTSSRDRAPRPTVHDPGDLGARVTQRRKELKLSRQMLAVRAGMSMPYLAYVEDHPAQPTVATVSQLAAALETTPEALLGAGANHPPGQRGASTRRVLQTLTPAECYDLLSSGGVGRVVFTAVDGPVVLPVNFAMVGQTVILRTGVDTQLAAHLDCRAGFEADRLDEALSQGWSVMITGRAVRVKKEEQVRRLEMETRLEPWAGGARDVYVQIIPLRISGRRIQS
jgi:nitroimidazol reductase NimA-like FMN-containing flavoprotein (pyridoxamine 5'-phosphate oxidase superfamily)